MDYKDLNTFLAWLAGPVGALACFVYVSNLIRGLQDDGKLTKLSPWQVQLLVMGISLVVPIGALVIVTVLPPETIAQAQSVYAIIATIAVAYLGQQGWYRLTKEDGTTGARVNDGSMRAG